jgi:sialidase-1
MFDSHRQLFITVLCLFALAEAAWSEDNNAHQRIFHSKHDGFPRFRIPSLVVTKAGTALAICEGRVDGGGLQGNVDLILRRSSDSGKTWSPIRVIADAGDDTLGNPCAVVDRETGHVWVAFTRSPGNFTEVQITRGESEGSTRVFVTHSEDDGKSWSKPRDITASTKKRGWTWYGTGPGVGIQLTDGRLFIPSYHCGGRKGVVTRSHSIFSDDHGKTWQLGASAGAGNGECQALQRKDGSIYLSARTSGDGPLERSIVTSSDRGASWSQKRFDKSLFDPHCEASLLALPTVSKNELIPPAWLYCAPAGPKRRNLTIRVSRDEGRTWPGSFLLRKGDGQYTSMAVLADGRIGVLYDCWEDDNYQLYFARVDLATVLKK